MLKILSMIFCSSFLITKTLSSWRFLPPTLASLTLLSTTLIYSPLSPTKMYSSFLLDSMSTPLISLSLWISALMFLSSTQILNSYPSRPFNAWILLLTFLLTLTFSLNNPLLFYIFFESTLIPTFMLILGWGYQPERLQASLYFVMYTILASLPLLVSILYLQTHLGHFSLSTQLATYPIPQTLLPLLWLFMNTAFLVKLPIFLFHLWLPKAHVEAPISGSMILAAILLKLGGYGLIRMTLLLPSPHPLLPTLLSSTALWGALLTALICLRQTDIKSMIAYSSVSHMGLLIAGTLTHSPLGLTGANMIMIAHGLTSSSLFSIANMTYEATNTRSIFMSKGLSTIAPYMALWWFLALAANISTPPSLNLLSEILLFSSILAWTSNIWPILALITLSNTAASLYLYTSTQHGQPPQFTNPLNISSPSNLTNLTLHLLPLILLTMYPELMSL